MTNPLSLKEYDACREAFFQHHGFEPDEVQLDFVYWQQGFAAALYHLRAELAKEEPDYWAVITEDSIGDTHEDSLWDGRGFANDHLNDILMDEDHPAKHGRVVPLYLRPSEPSKEPWRDIETAPKDGTAILLGSKGGTWIGKYLPVYTSGFRPANPWSSLMLNHDHMGEKWQPPTRWMPLPSTSKEKGQ